MVENFVSNFVANVISFLFNKEPLIRKMELRSIETFIIKVITLSVLKKTMIPNP